MNIFTNTLEKVKTFGRWCKRKAKQIIFVILGGAIMVYGASQIPTQIPAGLELKCDRADILESYQRTHYKSEIVGYGIIEGEEVPIYENIPQYDYIEYAYRTYIKIPKLDNEVKRTKVTLTLLERERFYEVKKGDTLNGISKQLNVDRNKIKNYKSKNPDLIEGGEILDLGSTQYSVESGHSQYFDGTDWYEVKFATTSPDAFRRQTISFIERVFALDTGWHSPTGTGGNFNQWTNGANAYSSNNEYAEVLTTNGSDLIQSYETFGFGVPGGMTIDGMECSVEWYNTAISQMTEVVVKVWLTDASQTLSKILTLIESEDTEVLGGATDLWYGDPIDTDFSDVNFYLYIKADGAFKGTDATTYLDHIQFKIYYTEPPPVVGAGELMFWE